MKKIISFIICILLLCNITAFATDVEKIQPDYEIISPNYNNTYDSPIIYIQPNTNTIIVIVGPENQTQPQQQTKPSHQIEKVEVKQEEETPTLIIDEPQIDEKDEVEQYIEHPLAEYIFQFTNEARVANGLKPLTYNFELQEAADLRARECAELFSHTRPNGQSCDTVVNVDYTVTGENLIQSDMEIASARLYVDTWMNSPGHRANILLKDFKSIAIGVCDDSDIVYATQIFIG